VCVRVYVCVFCENILFDALVCVCVCACVSEIISFVVCVCVYEST